MTSALIIFVKYPEPGGVKTRLGSRIGMGQAAALYREFAERIFRMALGMASDVAKVYVCFAPGPDPAAIRAWVGDDRCAYAEQKGESLGDRMRYAFQEAFSQGAMNAVLIGTDVPDIDASIVQRAFEGLQGHDAVLGPATDGGYYLLGMRAPGYEVFEGVPWSTPDVLPATLRLLTLEKLSVDLLPRLSDIDTEEDYRLYLSRQSATGEKGRA